MIPHMVIGTIWGWLLGTDQGTDEGLYLSKREWVGFVKGSRHWTDTSGICSLVRSLFGNLCSVARIAFISHEGLFRDTPRSYQCYLILSQSSSDSFATGAHNERPVQ